MSEMPGWCVRIGVVKMENIDSVGEGLNYMLEHHPWAMFGVGMVPVVIFSIIFYILWKRQR